MSKFKKKSIKVKGYENPYTVQLKTIPWLLEGRKAQTGTGKTAAFALPLLTRIDINIIRYGNYVKNIEVVVKNIEIRDHVV